MRWMKWFGTLAALILIASCFLDWVLIVSRNITVTGIDAEGTNFGRPGYMHFVFAGLFLLLNHTPRVWAKRANLLVTALNTAWAVRNFITVSTCSGGECPEKKIGIYLVIIASVIMLVAAMLPDIKIKEETR